MNKYAFSALFVLSLAGGSLVVACEDEPADDPAATADAGSADAIATDDGGTCAQFEPNNTKEEAKTIELDRQYSGLCVSNDDRSDDFDYFEFTTPNDAAGGTVAITVSNVQNEGTAQYVVYSVVDGETVHETSTLDYNGSISGWFSASPNQKYILEVARTGGPGQRFAYDLIAKYTATNDTFEPNNTKEQAKTIEKNVPISASFAAPSAKSQIVEGDDQDWYSVSVSGMPTFKLTNVPADYICELGVYDSAGESVGGNYNLTPGGDCVFTPVEALDAGNYFVNVHYFGGVPARSGSGAPPAFVTQQYTLEVSAP